MGTSADRDDKKKHKDAEADEHDAERDEDEGDDEEEEAPAPKKPSASSGKPKAAAKAAHDEDEADEEDDEEEEDEEDEAEAKHASKTAKSDKSDKSEKAEKADKDDRDDRDDKDDEEEEDDEEEAPPPKPSAKGARAKSRGPGATRGRQVAPSGSLGKSVLLFFVIVIGLGAGFAILGREQPAEVARPKWSVGQTVDVEVTLVKSDRQDLGCWSPEEVAGKHCAFEGAGKAWSKGGDPNDDKVVLKPYTTTDRMQFTAAGLWSDPALSPDKLPAARFSVKCKYKVEGTHKGLGVRWEQTGNWYPQDGWYAGAISGCSIVN